jgi:septum formation inhibitor MinC
MPAELTIVPIIDYQVARQHEKLLRIFYNTNYDEDHLGRLCQIVKDLVAVLGQKAINNRIIIQYEELSKKSFFKKYSEQVARKLRNFGLTVEFVTTTEVLTGAENFSYSIFFPKSVLFKGYE